MLFLLRSFRADMASSNAYRSQIGNLNKGKRLEVIGQLKSACLTEPALANYFQFFTRI